MYYLLYLLADAPAVATISVESWLAIIAAVGLQVVTILGLILAHLDNRTKLREQTRQLEISHQRNTENVTKQIEAKLDNGIKSSLDETQHKLDTLIDTTVTVEAERKARE